MGFGHVKLGIEFSVLTAVLAALFLWGLVSGKTVMKAPLSAERKVEPLKYWMGQTFFGLSCLLCLYVALTEMPTEISVRLIATH